MCFLMVVSNPSQCQSGPRHIMLASMLDMQERVREPAGQAAEQSEAVLMDAVMERFPEPTACPVVEEPESQAEEAAEVVERPRRASRDSGRPRVTFADDVQGGADEVQLLVYTLGCPPSCARRRRCCQGDHMHLQTFTWCAACSQAPSLSPRQPGGPLPPGQPVIVLDVEDAPQGSELGQQFGRLQVGCSIRELCWNSQNFFDSHPAHMQALPLYKILSGCLSVQVEEASP